MKQLIIMLFLQKKKGQRFIQQIEQKLKLFQVEILK